EIATALELTVGAVSSALHRARETIATRPLPAVNEPPPDVLRAYVRSWEDRDVDALVALLHRDVALVMPPHATSLRAREAVGRFVRGPGFATHWSAGFRVIATRANARCALAFYRRGEADYRPSSLQLVSCRDGQIVEWISFVGAGYLRGFALPESVAA